MLGIAVDAYGKVVAVTDAAGAPRLRPGRAGQPVTPTPVDAGGATLLALARRPSDGVLFVIGDSGGIVGRDPVTGSRRRWPRSASTIRASGST